LKGFVEILRVKGYLDKKLFMNEKIFEDILIKYPALIEDGLVLTGRQVTVYGRRMDLFFKDVHGRQLIVELKAGPIKDQHIGQVMSYEGLVLSHENPDLRIMLIGTRVPPNIQRSLDHHGIAWKEITISDIQRFLTKEKDGEFNKFLEKRFNIPLAPIAVFKKQNKFIYQGVQSCIPSLFIPIKKQEVEKAENKFKKGVEKVYFYSNSNIGEIDSLVVKSIYFKFKGDNQISVKADIVDFTQEFPKNYPLFEGESLQGKYYYGFINLRRLKQCVPLVDLKHFVSSKNLRNDVPGACIILDPGVE